MASAHGRPQGAGQVELVSTETAALQRAVIAAVAYMQHQDLEPMGKGDDGKPSVGDDHWAIYVEWEGIADRLEAELRAALRVAPVMAKKTKVLAEAARGMLGAMSSSHDWNRAEGVLRKALADYEGQP